MTKDELEREAMGRAYQLSNGTHSELAQAMRQAIRWREGFYAVASRREELETALRDLLASITDYRLAVTGGAVGSAAGSLAATMANVITVLNNIPSAKAGNPEPPGSR